MTKYSKNLINITGSLIKLRDVAKRDNEMYRYDHLDTAIIILKRLIKEELEREKVLRNVEIIG